ncbi:2OG-Fe(II) oxygenase [Phenylobacterium sp.]|uniref:2OG-Fe(II) oxygenase n=1 Tax=Phenylobacterium sp. TaxID=1871053 RepID=UPI002F400758
MTAASAPPPDRRPGNAASLPLTLGDPAPWFTADTPSQPAFTFNTVAGRYVLLGFLPLDPDQRQAAMVAAGANRALFDDVRLSAFLVARDPETAASARDKRGLRWFLDRDGAVSRLYGALDDQGTETPLWILLDPSLRVAGRAPLAAAAQVFQMLRRLPEPDGYAEVPLVAPVLIAPRILEPELCERLIALFDADGGAFGGVMRDGGARTRAVMDDFKKRRDVTIADPQLKAALRDALARRLFPQIHRAFQFQVTEIERYLLGCYDADDGGLFRAHRDDTTRQTANRKFACSINLNAGFEGGDLRFPEYGRTTCRPPVGGAVAFSCSLLHEATPVTRGRRYAFLPFFYDAAGARTLAAYLNSVESPQAPG